jgi:hypothetical protein
MGAHPYWYFTSYDPDHGAALQALRRREFLAGRYNPVVPFIDFPLNPASPSPGPRHATIDRALRASGADGTRSILDIDRTGDEPDHGVAVPLDDAVLLGLFGTTEPTHDMVESHQDFFGGIERGQAVYVVVYRDGRPDELLFAGYSFD